MMLNNVVIHSRYNCPKSDAIVFLEHGLTHQSFKDECDINLIVKRARVSGHLIDPFLSDSDKRKFHYGDFSSVDFFEANNIVNDAYDKFEMLDAEVRDFYHNDPLTLLKAFEDPNSFDDLERFKLLTKEEADSMRQKLNLSSVDDKVLNRDSSDSSFDS